MLTLDSIILPVLLSIDVIVCYLLYKKGIFNKPRRADSMFTAFGVTLPTVDIFQTSYAVQHGYEGNQAILWLVGNLPQYWFAVFALSHIALSVVSLYLGLKQKPEQERDARFLSAFLGLLWLLLIAWNFIALLNNVFIQQKPK